MRVSISLRIQQDKLSDFSGHFLIIPQIIFLISAFWWILFRTGRITNTFSRFYDSLNREMQIQCTAIKIPAINQHQLFFALFLLFGMICGFVKIAIDGIISYHELINVCAMISVGAFFIFLFTTLNLALLRWSMGFGSIMVAAALIIYFFVPFMGVLFLDGYLHIAKVAQHHENLTIMSLLILSLGMVAMFILVIGIPLKCLNDAKGVAKSVDFSRNHLEIQTLVTGWPRRHLVIFVIPFFIIVGGVLSLFSLHALVYFCDNAFGVSRTIISPAFEKMALFTNDAISSFAAAAGCRSLPKSIGKLVILIYLIPPLWWLWLQVFSFLGELRGYFRLWMGRGSGFVECPTGNIACLSRCSGIAIGRWIQQNFIVRFMKVKNHPFKGSWPIRLTKKTWWTIISSLGFRGCVKS